MRPTTYASTVIAAAIAMAATPAAAREQYLHAKAGATAEQLIQAENACVAAVRAAPGAGSPAMAVPYGGNIYAVAGVALIGGFMSGVQQSKARNAYLDGCLRREGYAKLTLTDDEAAQVEGLKDVEAKKAWITRFFASGIQGRVAAGLVPAVSPLPSDVDEPFAVGGVRLDLASVHIAQGPIGAGQPVFAAEARHRRTAKLAEPVELMSFGGFRIDAGAVFHEVDYRPAAVRDDESSLWCGPVSNGTVWGKRVTNESCFWSAFDGYHWGQAQRSQPWLVASPQTGGVRGVIKQGRLALEPSDTDLIGLSR